MLPQYCYPHIAEGRIKICSCNSVNMWPKEIFTRGFLCSPLGVSALVLAVGDMRKGSHVDTTLILNNLHFSCSKYSSPRKLPRLSNLQDQSLHFFLAALSNDQHKIRMAISFLLICFFFFPRKMGPVNPMW